MAAPEQGQEQDPQGPTTETAEYGLTNSHASIPFENMSTEALASSVQNVVSAIEGNIDQIAGDLAAQGIKIDANTAGLAVAQTTAEENKAALQTVTARVAANTAAIAALNTSDGLQDSDLEALRELIESLVDIGQDYIRIQFKGVNLDAQSSLQAAFDQTAFPQYYAEALEKGSKGEVTKLLCKFANGKSDIQANVQWESIDLPGFGPCYKGRGIYNDGSGDKQILEVVQKLRSFELNFRGAISGDEKVGEKLRWETKLFPVELTHSKDVFETPAS